VGHHTALQQHHHAAGLLWNHPPDVRPPSNSIPSNSTLIALWVPVSSNSSAIKVANWYGGAQDTSNNYTLPRSGQVYYNTLGTVTHNTWALYGTAGMQLGGYVLASVTNFATYLQYLSGGGVPIPSRPLLCRTPMGRLACFPPMCRVPSTSSEACSCPNR